MATVKINCSKWASQIVSESTHRFYTPVFVTHPNLKSLWDQTDFSNRYRIIGQMIDSNNVDVLAFHKKNPFRFELEGVVHGEWFEWFNNKGKKKMTKPNLGVKLGGIWNQLKDDVKVKINIETCRRNELCVKDFKILIDESYVDWTELYQLRYLVDYFRNGFWGAIEGIVSKEEYSAKVPHAISVLFIMAEKNPEASMNKIKELFVKYGDSKPSTNYLEQTRRLLSVFEY